MLFRSQLSQLYNNREYEAPIDVFTPQDDVEVSTSHEFGDSDSPESPAPYVDILATPDDFQLNEILRQMMKKVFQIRALRRITHGQKSFVLAVLLMQCHCYKKANLHHL